jgi:protoporphyrinogen oxidase
MNLNASSILKVSHVPKRYIQILWSIVKQAKKNKKHSYSFKHGMQELVDNLTAKIQTQIIYNSKLKPTHLNANELHIVCTDAHQAAELLETITPSEVTQSLKAIKYKKITSTTIFTTQPITSLDKSFGILFAESSLHPHFGILNNCEIFPYRSKNQKFSYTLIGPRVAEDQLKIDITKTLEQIDFKHNFINYPNHWERAIPLYDQSRLENINTIKSHLPCNIVLIANYTDGISLREIFHNGVKLAGLLKEHYFSS